MAYVPFEHRGTKPECGFCGRRDYIIPVQGTAKETEGLVFCSIMEETMYKFRKRYNYFQPVKEKR